jgi:hypothetical protein
MTRFINRDWNRTENDDFCLNVQSSLTSNSEAIPLYYNNEIIGWKIQLKYE